MNLLSIDDLFQSGSIGSVKRAMANSLYGINRSASHTATPSAYYSKGLTLFVRPQQNLQTENIEMVRSLYSLLDEDSYSIQRAIRVTLDPRQMIGYGAKKAVVPPLTCPLIDNDQAFIPMLTNNFESVSGWPGMVVPTETSKPGVQKETHTMVNGVGSLNGTFDFTLSFRRTHGDPVMALLLNWQTISWLTFIGRMSPYIDLMLEFEIDYNTRMWRIVLDKNDDIVEKIASTGPAVWVSAPVGAELDYNIHEDFNTGSKSQSFRLKADGVEMFDEGLLIYEFNETVEMFCPNMLDENRESSMVSVPKGLRDLFRQRGYFRIDPYTHRLETWVHKDYYLNRLKAFTDGTYLNNYTDSLAGT